jgi:3-oxoacyl-[acyl-carrier protein] reductase
MASRFELLTGKTAVITGCNRGIGKAILEGFAVNGADVFACARKESAEFSECTSRLSDKYSVRIIPVYFDACNIEEIKSAAKQILSSKKPLDVLVNNAGIGYNALFQMSSPDKLKEVFNVNFMGPFVFTQYITKSMVRNKSGSIINISSTAGIDGSAGKSVYGASKAAMICMTKVIATELGLFGIRANTIAPGMTETDMMSCLPEEAVLENIQTIGLKRLGKPSEIADTAVFLASELSAYITGQVIRVDGGLK